jgi:predicted NBD/HSP70 family sugar kinase
LLSHAPVSRADLAKTTGLSKQTISEVVDFLERQGWVHATGRTSGKVGRTAVNYEIRNDAAYVFGVDLGGTKIAAALADMACNIVAETNEPTDHRGGLAVIDQLGSILNRLATEAKIKASAVRLAVIGSPGVLDTRAGSMALAPNIPGFDAFDVLAAARTALGCSVEIENDVNLAVLGERWRGCAAGVDHVAFIALGTGIGLGVVSGGTLLRGARGAAGEIAFLPLDGNPTREDERRHGALELAIGAAGIMRRYEGLGGRGGAAVRDLFDWAEEGDAAARTALNDAAGLVARAVLSVVSIVDPDMVVLGGSIGARPEMVAKVRQHYAAMAPSECPIVGTNLGSRAGLMGALAVALNRVHNQLFGVQDLTGEVALPSAADRTGRSDSSVPAEAAQ